MKIILLLVLVSYANLFGQSYSFDILYETNDNISGSNIYLRNTQDSTYVLHIFKSYKGFTGELRDFKNKVNHIYDVSDDGELNMKFLSTSKTNDYTSKKVSYKNVSIDSVRIEKAPTIIQTKITIKYDYFENNRKKYLQTVEFVFNDDCPETFDNSFFLYGLPKEIASKLLGKYLIKEPESIFSKENEIHQRNMSIVNSKRINTVLKVETTN